MSKEVENKNLENEVVEAETKTAKKAEKKVKVRIPKDSLNTTDTFVPVTINGKITQIKRGEDVEVSEEIARILRDSGYLG
jgi:hypothetical protein